MNINITDTIKGIIQAFVSGENKNYTTSEIYRAVEVAHRKELYDFCISVKHADKEDDILAQCDMNVDNETRLKFRTMVTSVLLFYPRDTEKEASGSGTKNDDESPSLNNIDNEYTKWLGCSDKSSFNNDKQNELHTFQLKSSPQLSNTQSFSFHY